MNFNLDRNTNFFNSNDSSLDFLIENNIITSSIICPSCRNRYNLKETMKDGNKMLFYRCNSINCRRKISYISKTILKGTRLLMKDGFLFVYCYVLDIRVYTITNLNGISQATYIFLR